MVFDSTVLSPRVVFVQTTTPTDITEGKLWFDTSTDTLKVSDGTEYLGLNPVVVDDTEPTNKAIGSLWYDTENNLLFSADGTNYNSVSGRKLLAEVSNLTEVTGLDTSKYKTLEIEYSGIASYTGEINLQFNSDTSSLYSFSNIRNAGTPSIGETSTSITFGTTYSSGIFSYNFRIQNKSDMYKVLSCNGTYSPLASYPEIYLSNGCYRSNDIITAIKFSGTVSSSTIKVWGII